MHSFEDRTMAYLNRFNKKLIQNMVGKCFGAFQRIQTRIKWHTKSRPGPDPDQTRRPGPKPRGAVYLFFRSDKTAVCEIPTTLMIYSSEMRGFRRLFLVFHTLMFY
jgi:hypothetical protein